MITRERWQRIKDLFNRALQRPAADRVKFLAEACEGDDSIRAEVESLISAHEEDESFLDGPAYEFAAEMLADESPELKAGDRLGPYTVLSVLGKGGMGEVYLAQDARLGRNIAVKLLAPEFARDEQRVLRFEQEARAASALNHPNVCVIHEIGRAEDGRHFMAMEFIDGLTLRRRMAQKRLTLTEALDVAVQVAWALEAAHAAGIVHRDIKPENIMLRRDGYVKVLDFGIAKLNRHPTHSHISPEVSTVAHLHTAPGTLMGTVKYMSPEQLREQPIDARTDIWSLGVVLHEMVTGFTPFEAPTTNDTIAAILERHPTRLDFFATEVPEGFRQVIRKALSKKRRERYQTIKELAADLRELRRQQSNKSGTERSQQATLDLDMTGTDEKPLVGTGGSTILSKFKLQALRTADYVLSEIKQHKKAAIFTGATAIFAALLLIPKVQCWTGRAPCSGGLSTPSWQSRSHTNSAKSVCAAISPDGRFVAHAEEKDGKQSLLLTLIDNPGAPQEMVPPSEVAYRGITFSRDGTHVYFTIQKAKDELSVLHQVPILGGVSSKIKEGVDSPISFSPNGDRFAFVRSHSVRREYSLVISGVDGTGERILVTKRDANTLSVGPAWSPDGKTIVCAVGWWANGYHASLVEYDVETGNERPIKSQPWYSIFQVAWLQDGSRLIICAQERSLRPIQLWQVSYPDGESKKISTDQLDYESVSVSGDGNTIASVQRHRVGKVFVAPDGDALRAKAITSTVARVYGLDWTTKDKIVLSSMAGDDLNLSLLDADGSQEAQVTANTGDNYTPATSRDGKYIVFASNRTGSLNIWRINAADGSDPKQLTFSDANSYPSVSPDGQWVFYDNQNDSTFTVWKVPIDGGAAVQLTDQYTRMPIVSPNGQLFACRYLVEGGSREIAIFPVSGGSNPIERLPIRVLDWQRIQWTADGRALTYIDTVKGISNIWRYDLTSRLPKQLTDFKTDETTFAYSWSPDYKQLACHRGTNIRDVIIFSHQR
jgi:serine/threonine protein kinase/dipeptidyl aminopeptidase/acylaminoacyl peptidase